MKLIGAYIPDETDQALAVLAKKRGFATKTDFLRALYDAALEEDARSAARSPKKTLPIAPTAESVPATLPSGSRPVAPTAHPSKKKRQAPARK